MILTSLLSLVAASTALASPMMDMRGLSRLANETLAGRAVFPSGGFHGVNLGAWFVFEPYMAVAEWESMGGDALCSDCTTCVNDEFRLTAKLGQAAANTAFANHWNTFITQTDVNLMVSYGINAVRIPVGFWIIESTVISGETYPQGGLAYLKKACAMFKAAGISVLIDLHAAPGVQTPSNPFTGHCLATTGFWTQSNFNRMTAAAAALATAIHQDTTSYGSVWGIEALNEPPTDGSQTPGYYTYMSQFVSAVRNAENALGVAAASQLSTVFMDVSWQWENNAGNPAYVANGGNAYDSHLYYSFGAPCGSSGCVTDTLASHINFACTGGGGRIASDTAAYNTPSFLGEWWLEPLPGTFSFTDQSSVRQFGDAQKRGYSPEGGNGGFGWFFWSWKMTNSDSDGSNHMRSYKDAVAQGYLPATASSYYNSAICS